MPFDQHKNLAISQVEIPPVPADSGTQLQVVSGQGVRFPVAPFDVTIWRASEYPNPANAEVARCTAVSGDILFLDRAQGGTTARAVQIGDLIAESITVAYLLSIESGLNFPQIVTGSVTAPLGQFGSLGTTPLDPAFIIAPIPDAKLSVNVLTHPGGYPGGTTTFLRADGTFGGVSGGLPLHAPTHAEGGTDPVQLTQSQVTGLTTTLTSIEGDITTLEGDVTTLQTIVTSGPVALHAPTHSAGGTDPVTVTALAGYPGGPTLFLNADGVFAVPAGGGGGTPGLHAITHTPGNTDPIPNVGWLNVANTWTAAQTLNGVDLFLSTTASRLRFGTTTTDPLIKRNGSQLEVRNGNDTLQAILRAFLVATDIQSGTLPLARIQFSGSPRLLGRGSASSGDAEQITLGTGLTMTGTVLSAAGAGADEVSVGATDPGATYELWYDTAAVSPTNNYALLNTANTFTQSQAITGNLSVSGAGTFGGDVVMAAGTAIKQSTDSSLVQLFGASGAVDLSRGAALNVGSVTSGSSGSIDLYAASAGTGRLNFAPGGTIRGIMHSSGGFSWGSTTDPGAGNLSVLGNVLIGGDKAIIRTTNDGADNGYLQLGGGGAATPDRGGHINLFGNEFAAYPGGGTIQLVPGNAGVGGKIEFYSGNATLRGTVHPSGGFSWGGTADPGAACLMVGSAVSTAAGQSYAHIGSLGTIQIGIAGTAAANRLNFENANGSVGTIMVSGTTTTYNTTSDARLKTPLGRHTDPDVLRQTVVHNFVWKSDGTPGRGVFAQEAHSVAPFAVSVGSDEVDEAGRLTHPWGVDYSKYVPDLITGWQAHDAELAKLRGDNDALLARLVALEVSPPMPRMALWQRVREAIAVLFPAWITP